MYWVGDILSAGVEPPGLGLVGELLLLGANLPYYAGDAEHGGAEDKGVLPPVGGLGVPATGGRPNVLGVTCRRSEGG